MRLALAQINTTVGDIDANAAKVVEWAAQAGREGADLVLFPELTLSGYPAEDLYLQGHFAARCAEKVEELAAEITGIAALVGFPEPEPDGGVGTRDRARPFNSLALIRGGRVDAIYRKGSLPNYGVFDELRQFLADGSPVIRQVAGTEVGLTICEDCWNGGELAAGEVSAGAGLIVNASASPWCRGRGASRESVFSRLAGRLGRPVAVCNLVGAQDGLVFDGQSLVVDAGGDVVARAAQFSEDLLIYDLAGDLAAGERAGGGAAVERVGATEGAGNEAAGELARVDGMTGQLPAPPGGLEELRAGLALGLRDYVVKNGFSGVVLGLSGGIDSALVAALAVEALGPRQVTCLVMPSPHSSQATQDDARGMARHLGTRLIELPIGESMAAYEATLAGAGQEAGGLSAENIQARIRGNLVMAISNRDGLLALSCGNKSEASVGYATLYGDMAGGLAPIKDLSKTVVYELAREFNRSGLRLPADAPLGSDPVTGAGVGADAGASPDAAVIEAPIPAGIVARPPSAELRPDQLDSDSLPPYELLDPALEAHVERDLGLTEMVAEGIDPAVAERVIDLVRISEHKRHQSAPGIRVTAKALDRDRRMPITNRYRPG